MSKFVLGGGITGLAAGIATQWPVFEAREFPGGICSSYYMMPKKGERFFSPPERQAYRFEFGGGHWIFGHRENWELISKFATLKTYERKSSVFFSKEKLFVPYPIQNNLHALPEALHTKALEEMEKLAAEAKGEIRTMEKWLKAYFGTTLFGQFFGPFHERYTANLQKKIAPQDAYKSPLSIEQVREGAQGPGRNVGYNTVFAYPEEGLDSLARNMARECDIQYAKKVVRIDTAAHILYFQDGTSLPYETVFSTLPLNTMAAISGIEIPEKADPYTSVLVLNIGAERGRECPEDHWLYIPDAQSPFYRVGFYSNVDRSFVPSIGRSKKERVGLYVERSFLPEQKPSGEEIRTYSQDVVRELQEWQFIGETEIVDATWIDVAYTWAWPGSQWRQSTIEKLRNHRIIQIGRYGRWEFQGIAESMKEGYASSGNKETAYPQNNSARTEESRLTARKRAGHDNEAE